VMINILTQSLWRDEAFSALLSLKGLGQIISVAASDYSPPLYYVFLHFWIKLFGFGEVALRIPSLLFSVLTAGSAYFLTKKLFSKKVALLTFFFVLLNPFLFHYAFEARMYTLFSFFAVLSFYFLIFENWPLFVLFSLLGLYSHNFMIFSLLGELIAYLFLKGFGKKKHLLVSFGGILLGFSPWVGTLFSQAREVARGFWIERPGIRAVSEALVQFLFGPSGGNSRYLIFMVLISGLVIFLWRLSASRRDKAERKKIASLIIWASLSFFSSFLLSYFIPVFLPRYLIFIIIPLSLVLAFILMGLPFRIPIIFCFLVLFLVRDFGIWGDPSKFPIREKVFTISKSWEGEPVVCESILNFFEVKYYLMRSKPAAAERIYLLSSGRVEYAGGSLVERGEICENLPEERYFWVSRSGDTYLLKN